MSVLAVGTVALDSIETPFEKQDDVLGGSAMYITLAARFFTPFVRLVAVVGNDFPQRYFEQLRTSGVDLEGLEVDPEGKTFSWSGRYHYNLNNRDTLATHLNVLETFDPVVPASYRNSRIVCLGNLAPKTQQSVLAQVENPALVVCDTMNFWIEHTLVDLQDTLRLVDCLIINDAEARELAQEPNLIRAARKVQAMGPRILVIKKGEHGALLFVEDVVFSAPAYPLEDIQDPTGAGDAFMGGFAGYLAQADRIDTEALKNAVIYGSAMASFCVEDFGPARLLRLDNHEITRRMHEFRQLSAFPFMLEPGDLVAK